MANIVLITSVINTPNRPLSYTKIRSVFLRNERFEQTKETIYSIQKYLPDSKIIMVECSNLTEEENDFFNKHCKLLNLWNKPEVHSSIFGVSKSLGEGTLMIHALKYLFENKVNFDSLYKLSGRYTINGNFKNDVTENNIFKPINRDISNVSTVLYKIDYNNAKLLLQFLENNVSLMERCIGYENLIAMFVKKLPNKNYVDTIGASGVIAVDTLKQRQEF